MASPTIIGAPDAAKATNMRSMISVAGTSAGTLIPVSIQRTATNVTATPPTTSNAVHGFLPSGFQFENTPQNCRRDVFLTTTTWHIGLYRK